MANSQAGSFLNLSSATAMQVELIWQMAKISLAANNQQVLVNNTLYQLIGDVGLEEIKLRLSELLGNVPVVACLDHVTDIIHVMRHPSHATDTNNDTVMTTDPVQPSSPNSIATDDSCPKPALRAFGKKSKIPRPPNAFILYRQHWHPHYKQHNKEMHNNDISKELGRRWKMESASVKEQYKKLAEELKAKHAELYPDYQYAPRRPGEKKRRMTARKLELLRAAQHAQEEPYFPSPESSGVSFAGPQDQVAPTGYSLNSVTTASQSNGINLTGMSTPPPQPVQYQENDTFTSTLPSSFDNIQAEIDKECGKYGVDYADVAENNDSLINLQFGDRMLQASGAEIQPDQQNEWESLIDWQGLENTMIQTQEMVEDAERDLVVEQSSGPDQTHKSTEDSNIC